MPAQVRKASFEPIPPDFDLDKFVEAHDHCEFVVRTNVDAIKEHGYDVFERLVLQYVIIGGKPLVVEGFEKTWDPWLFTPRWLRDNHGNKIEYAKDLANKETIPLTIAHYLNNMRDLTNQWTEETLKDRNRQRVYLKDIDCPQVWQDKMKEIIPEGFFYLNESTGSVDGPGAIDESGSAGVKRRGRGVARAGDLMSSLPAEMRAENLMCYIGHEGTFTPAHKEMCGSLGQNIMVECSGSVGEDGKPEKPGSSLWFMTETKDRQTVSEYWLSVLGHDIEIEDHFAQVNAWKNAPFKVWILEQKAGDFLLIPPLAPHQVWNRGTRTMKIAWNRTTVETLEFALAEALPKARLVCRDEQYKNKAIIYFTLMKYSGLLARVDSMMAMNQREVLQSSRKIRQLRKDFRRLFKLYQQMLVSEMFSSDVGDPKPNFVPFDGNVTCAYCRGNIFNRFLTCGTCTTVLEQSQEEPYDICMECYAMGRSCECISKYKWVEQFRWKELNKKYEEWRQQVIGTLVAEGKGNEAWPLTLDQYRVAQNKKTFAQICQEQLKVRPWRDITKPEPEELKSGDEEEEIEVNEDGTAKKSKKRRSQAWLNSHSTCHVCHHKHPNWKIATCTNCNKGWCYGSLFRAFDLMPQKVMEDLVWECPHCEHRCNVGRCKRDPRQNPYEPKGTLLGHDTTKVADVRSVESLVDFSVSNLKWLPANDEPLTNARIRRHKENADKERELHADLDEHYADDDTEGENDDTMAIDPTLDDDSPALRHDGQQHAITLPSVSDMLDGAGPDPDPPSPRRYTRAPTAPMYSNAVPSQDLDLNDDGDDDTVAAALRGSENTKIKGKVRREVSSNAAATKGSPRGASAQYLDAQRKVALREARREGRLTAFHAARQGRHKYVHLRLPMEMLERLATRRAQQSLASDDPDEDSQANVLIRSDVQADPATLADKEPETVHRKRKQKQKNGNRRSSAKKPVYKEVDTDSEPEDLESDKDDVAASEMEQRPTKRQRISNYFARKWQEESEDLPSKLPEDDRKDSRKGLSGKPHSRRSYTRKALRSKPSSAAEVITSETLAGDAERDAREGGAIATINGTQRQPDPPETRVAALNGDRRSTPDNASAAASSNGEVENDNVRAKLAIAGIEADESMGEEGNFESVDDAAPAKTRPVARTRGSRGGSIMSRGKNIKIRSMVAADHRPFSPVLDSASTLALAESALRRVKEMTTTTTTTTVPGATRGAPRGRAAPRGRRGRPRKTLP